MKTPTQLIDIAKTIRTDVIKSLTAAGSGHLGASLGLADIFTVLYFHEMKHNPRNPKMHDRDRLILSIGHAAPVLYASLANALYFEKKELLTLRKIESRLQGHPDKNKKLPGLETSSGSLGQGLSISVGLALAAKINKENWRTFCILGDGEIQGGSVWEAAMSASHYQLENLIAILDRNYCQIDGNTEQVMSIEPLNEKWTSFGWNVFECNGNNISEIISALNNTKTKNKKPSIIIAKTKMGKGIKSIENNYLWHGKVPTIEEEKIFLEELMN